MRSAAVIAANDGGELSCQRAVRKSGRVVLRSTLTEVVAKKNLYLGILLRTGEELSQRRKGAKKMPRKRGEQEFATIARKLGKNVVAGASKWCGLMVRGAAERRVERAVRRLPRLIGEVVGGVGIDDVEAVAGVVQLEDWRRGGD
jgi:hypothetical protein